MAKTITIEVDDATFNRIRGSFVKLRAARIAQGFGSHPLAGRDREAARKWFLAAALETGAEDLAEIGPG